MFAWDLCARVEYYGDSASGRKKFVHFFYKKKKIIKKKLSTKVDMFVNFHLTMPLDSFLLALASRDDHPNAMYLIEELTCRQNSYLQQYLEFWSNAGTSPDALYHYESSINTYNTNVNNSNNNSSNSNNNNNNNNNANFTPASLLPTEFCLQFRKLTQPAAPSNTPAATTSSNPMDNHVFRRMPRYWGCLPLRLLPVFDIILSRALEHGNMDLFTTIITRYEG
jgi:hypothetical protein